MNTPTRDFLRRPDGTRRRSVRQALAVIPNVGGVTMSPGEPLALEVNAMDNLLNSRHTSDTWSPVPSPDEFVIQKRGQRRRSIVWSPDLDACKRDSLLSLRSRDRTPVKSPSKASMTLRNTPRKRLALGDTEAQYTTPEKKKKPVLMKSFDSNSSQKYFSGSLINGLRGLSHEQLVKMVMDLVSMQEDGMLRDGDKIRTILLKKMPMADIQPLKEKLICLRQNIYASLVSSNLDDSAYSRAYIHLDAFQKALMEQGRKLLDSQHWASVMQYVYTAWNITKELPEWESQGFDNTTRKCFKNLAQLCVQAIRRGGFTAPTLDAYAQRLETMVEDCADVNMCLQLIKDAKRNDV